MRAFAFAAVLVATPALADECVRIAEETQLLCKQRSQLVAELAAEYGETARWIGATDHPGVVMEMFTNQSGEGTWTVLLSGPQGCSCITEYGTASTPITNNGVKH